MSHSPTITLNHIAIAVPDLDAALTFYRDALGISVKAVEDVPQEGVKVAFLPLGAESETFGDAHPPQIELVQPTREGTGIAKWLNKHGAGMHHLCVQVPDIQAAMQQAQAHGAELINQTPARRDNGVLYAFIHPKSSFGVLIELYQPPAQPA
jgi:methylmalonyl-CoA/ethylmalonyl-CoA epimerase